ncbi:apoptosis regulator BAX [Austrofundulus limnaeus]|uniref:Apoptosis regulator BAX n=1 Tax=Austrofundulus limnaeus TaxID=52670 RepID=A0A2I4CG51_AUSLI|nr:PREDICTED: apoptosis regulator BAX-like [Austrofundulus limnaeus]
MASGGDGDQGCGNITDQILDLGIRLLKDFIYNWIQRHVNSITLTREDLGAEELHEPKHKKVAHGMQIIADELDNDAGLQTTINDSSIKPSVEVFERIARLIFEDGKFNWGRVVTFFYFVCKLVIQAYKPRILEIIRTIINWAIDFLREHLINWIKEQGGWEGILSYFGTPTWQTVCVFLAGIFTAFVIIRKK